MLSIVIFVIQVWVFGGITLYLHYRSEKYGLSPLLFYVAGIMGVLNLIELITLYVEPAPGVVIRPGGHVYVPIILLIVLILYVSSGTRSARITIAGLVGVNLLILVVLMFLLLYINFSDSTTVIRGLFAEANVLTPLFLRGVLASVVTFTLNMLVIIIVYQGIRNTFPTFPESFIPGIALIIALWVDAILYNILAFLGTPFFVPGIPGDVIMKTLAGLLLAPLVGWYLTHKAPKLSRFQGANDRPTFAIVFGEESFVSRLHELESELQVSRAIYEQIMQNIEEVFWLVDIEKNRLLYISPNFEKLTGKRREIFFKNPAALMALVHPEDRAGDVIEQLFLSPNTEFRIRHTDGSIRWLRNRSFPIMTPDQQIVRYAGITEDVTAQREAQTQAFALQLSRDKVKLLQNFVRDASHDLRSPLTSILLKLDLLPRVSAERQNVLIEELHTVAQHLNNLIDDLFTLSLIESDGSASLSTLDFNDVIRQACEDHRAIAQDKGLTLTLDLTEQALKVYGNRKQLFRLAANLVANAIHYTEQGTITARSSAQDGHAVLEVTDTGMGIPKEDLEAIFNRFFRTEQARNQRRDGTGLGLAICKAIVEQHDGTISVESTLGQGSIFRVCIPLAKRDVPQNDKV